MNRIFRNIILLAFLWVSISLGFTQTTNLSGTINTPVSAVISVAANSVDVLSTAGFAIDDIVLIIQMKGATMDETNTANFGAITNIGNAGNYELAVICDILGQTISFQGALTRTYNSSGSVQVIKVPSYSNINVTGTLNAPAWNKTTKTGGVLVLHTPGSITLNANINMNARGFFGGWRQNNYAGCSCGCAITTQYPDYFYVSGSCRSASKGEGIVDTIISKEFGKGRQVNGGGGGNDHNAGGGGGANFGAGGQGGTANSPTCFFGAYCRGLNPGLGGLGLSTHYTTSNKLFLGGGGGAGHSNNPLNVAGRPGGGIVIIIANSIIGQGNAIFARGGDVTGLNDGDGAGGGGGGGSILIHATSFTGSLNLIASGGNGGNLSPASLTNCKGPGGGGGGGVIWSQNTLPGSVVTSVAGGANGSHLIGPCAGLTNGATAGTTGGILTGLSLSLASLVCPTPLSVEMSDLIASCEDGELSLKWSTTSEIDNDYFEIQHSIDGYSFAPFEKVNGAGQSQETIEYEHIISHRHFLNGYYRLKQVDFNGGFDFSNIASINCLSDQVFVHILNGKLLIQNGAKITACKIYDMLGRQIFSGNPVEMDFNFFSDSFYFVHLESDAGFTNHKVYNR